MSGSRSHPSDTEHTQGRPVPGQARLYRRHAAAAKLVSYRVRVQETDLSIQTVSSERTAAKEAVLSYRSHIERYIRIHPGFATSLRPWPDDDLAPAIVQDMITAGKRSGVGPMAAVAGAVAGRVGTALLALSPEVVVENGGDVFARTATPITCAIFAGPSPLSMKVGLKIGTELMPVGVCTSSGTVGHSYSQGCADAVCVISASCAGADAAATAIGNRIRRPDDIQDGIDYGQQIQGVDGIVIIVGERIGLWGRVQLEPV